MHDVAWRAIQVHGALATTNETPLMQYGSLRRSPWRWLTGLQRCTRSRWPSQVLRDYKASDDVWPTAVAARRKRDAARAKFAEYLELEVGNL